MTAPPSSIPARRTRLIGRDDDLLAIRDLLLHGDSRLVTISGTGGAGKTTLAHEAARLLEPAMPDGAVLVDLTTVHEPDAVPTACCEALGLIDSDAAPTRMLTTHLAPRHLLLVLDNCEHLGPAAGALIDRLLDACPDLRVLTTSRVRLRVQGESVHAVGPLPVPEDRARHHLGRLARIPAVELFVERATAVDPAFTLADWAPSVAAVCRRLAGLPLAIELAAAHLSALTPIELEERLSAHVILDGRGHAGAARQRTMDATLAWSHSLLDEREQALFRRLAVFNGGWTLAAAERVCAGGDDPSTIVTSLVSLVDHSLVYRDRDHPGSRFHMLAPVAEYAARQLAASGELVPTSLVHADHYLAAISHETTDWREIGPEQLARIAAEYDNAQAAMRFAEREQLVPLLLGYSLALLLFWRVRGLLRSGFRRLEAALELVDDPARPERALVLAGLAHFGQLLGELETADTRAAESDAIFEAAGDLIGRRTVLGFRGDIAADGGDVDAALAHYALARDLVGPEASALDLGFWHANIGRLAVRRGELQVGERELEAARVHLRATSGWYQGHVLVQLGSLARRRGDLDGADALLREALGHLHRFGAAIEAASCLIELGRIALARDDHRRAASLFGAAVGLRDVTGSALRVDEHEGLGRDINRARSALARHAFTQAWSRGRGATLDEAVEFVEAPVTARVVVRPPPSRSASLTPRETEVAGLVSRGMTNRQIADQLAIAPGTARIHVERILGKLGLTSRVQVATWVIGEPGSTSPPTVGAPPPRG